MRMLAALFGLLLAGSVSAQTLPQKVWNLQSPMVPLGYCQQTGVSTAVGLSSGSGKCANGIPAGAVFAVVEVESEAARWRDDGTAATASVGQPLAVLSPIYFTVNPLSNVSIIPQTGSMTLNVSFYGIR